MLPTHPHTGSTLKKEMTACNTIALDLPKGHNLRKSLLQYKQRFEDAVDELLDCAGFLHMVALNHTSLLLTIS